MNTISLKLTCKQFSKSWAVYGLFDVATNLAVYIGCIKLCNFFTLSDARTVLQLEPETELIIMLSGVYETKTEAIIEQSRKTIELGLKIRTSARGTAVRCVTTGETFVNAQEAVNMHDLTYSALCNHLNRVPGHVTVKQKVYERITRMEYFREQGLIKKMPTPTPYRSIK